MKKGRAGFAEFVALCSSRGRIKILRQKKSLTEVLTATRGWAAREKRVRSRGGLLLSSSEGKIKERRNHPRGFPSGGERSDPIVLAKEGKRGRKRDKKRKNF